jgi:hypothetical protein
MCISTDPIFYVYVYLDPRKPGYYVYGNYIFEYEPFYVGKGKNGRSHVHLFESKQKYNGNKHFSRKIKKIHKECCIDPIIIKVKDTLTEDMAFEIEKEMIFVIGRSDKKLGTLCNLTDGGQGSSGYKFTSEQVEKCRKSHIGITLSDEAKKKVGKSSRERKYSDEVKRLRSEQHRKYSTDIVMEIITLKPYKTWKELSIILSIPISTLRKIYKRRGYICDRIPDSN